MVSIINADMKKFLERSFHPRHPVITVRDVLEPISYGKPQKIEFNSNRGSTIATVALFPQAMSSITTMVVPSSGIQPVPPETSPPARHLTKSLIDEIREPTRFGSKFRKRLKSNVKKSSHNQHIYMSKLLSKSLNAAEDLKAVKATLGEIATKNAFINYKITELRDRIDLLYLLVTTTNCSNEDLDRRDSTSRQKVVQEECYELLLQLQEEGWIADEIDAEGPDES